MSYRDNSGWKAARAALVDGIPEGGPIDNLLFRLAAIDRMQAIETAVLLRPAGGGAS